MTGSEVVAAARGTPEQQAEATSKFAKHFEELLTAGLTLAGASKVHVRRDLSVGTLILENNKGFSCRQLDTVTYLADVSVGWGQLPTEMSAR